MTYGPHCTGETHGACVHRDDLWGALTRGRHMGLTHAGTTHGTHLHGTTDGPHAHKDDIWPHYTREDKWTAPVRGTTYGTYLHGRDPLAFRGRPHSPAPHVWLGLARAPKTKTSTSRTVDQFVRRRSRGRLWSRPS